MKVEIKNTNELSDIELQQYCKCHENVYGIPSSIEDFLNVYKKTCFGYSFHALLYNDDNIIVGGYSLIPFIYDVAGEEKKFAYASALMIEKKYRGDFTNLFGLVKAMLKTAKKNFSCIYIFPNDNADIVNKQLIKAERIGELNIYLLPYKVGTYKESLSFMNPITKIATNVMLCCSKLGRNIIKTPLISKDRQDLEANRLNWFNYSTYKDSEMQATWNVAMFEGIRAAFLIDVWPLSKHNFDKAVRIMFEREKNNVGLFLYVGLLSFKPFSMIKVPANLSPKKFRFDIKIFDNSLSLDIINNPYNWDINLSSYDLI